MRIRFRTLSAAFVSLTAAFAPSAVLPFDGHQVRKGPLTLTIGEVEEVTAFGTPQKVVVTVRNASEQALAVRLRVDNLVDEWSVVGDKVKQLDVPAGKTLGTAFSVAAGRGAYSALYPVHVYANARHGGQEIKAHAVRIISSRFPQKAGPASAAGDLPLHAVLARGVLPLAELRTQRVAWRYHDRPLVTLPVGWRGSAPPSSAGFSTHSVTRDTTKNAIQMHPPWRGGAGTIFAEYRLKLPDTQSGEPIEFRFANAIRDHSESEPPSDGVTFRVWAGKEKLFEHHTASKRWVEARVDLTRFRGQEILLRLESHPGPQRNTTCDSSYWGDPVVIAGREPPRLTEEERSQLRTRARQMITPGKASGKDAFLFQLEGGLHAGLVLGPNGLVDSALALGSRDRCVVLDGVSVSVRKHKVGAWPSAIRVAKVVKKLVTRLEGTSARPFKQLRVDHHLELPDAQFVLRGTVWQDKAGLRIKFHSPERITDIALGAADQKAPRVYYGHGYCIEEPEAFRSGFGGHNLSTSHVGFEFEQGVSLLTACDHPPDSLQVEPARRIYALHTHLDATLTLVPSVEGVFDCARKYRPLYDKQRAPGFERKAGRFVFDIWGGRYADIADTMKRLIAYGLVDSLLTVHVWQRWGYDYRLPDIYPPQPGLGTVEDLQRLAAVCAASDIPWGLHDNYIDYYPDAEDFSYEHICFTEGGEPIKAWINRGRDAQSYRWRPDHILPFVQRNLKLIKPNLQPTHYFIDVFTSIPCFDYYDRHGAYHSMLETRRCWGEAFAWIRDTLGDNAPMTSEAGHDQLVGYIAGSDCQHLQITDQSKRFCIRIGCKDWERVPWFDAVLHDKFSLHGVGYSGRYEGGRGREHHGIESDDYVSAEILEGHALMIDRGGFGRGAVRKYWLAQDFVRSIAADSIAGVEFVDGDIHRQTVSWESGARVHVNRGERDWTVAGKTLPQYGYVAQSGAVISSIEKINGVIVEQSRGPDRFYFNARGFSPLRRLEMEPTLGRVESLGGRKFRMSLSWDVQQAPPRDLAIFVHFTHERAERSDKIAFQGDSSASTGMTRWKGVVTTGARRTVEIPAQFGAGTYDILVGVWDPSEGGRFALRGDDQGDRRYLVGKLVAEGEGAKVTGIRGIRHTPKPQPAPRWNVSKLPVDFGPVITCGALAVQCRVDKDRKGDRMAVRPLPDGDAFRVTLRTEELTGKAGRGVKSVSAVDADGKLVRQVPFEAEPGQVTFRVEPGEFEYRVQLQGSP